MKLVINLNHRLRCWNISKSQVERLQAQFPDLDISVARSRAEIACEIVDADIFYGWDIEDEWLVSAPNLRLIATPAAGLEWIVCPAMLTANVILVNGSFHGKIISESVIGMMLFFERNLGRQYALQKSVPWRLDDSVATLGSLKGKTLLVVGAGNIGGEIARKARAFDMRIIGIKRAPSTKPDPFDEIHTPERLNSCLKAADHVVVVLPATSETTSIIGCEQFSVMKSSAYIYNVGRGNAIDEEALVDALDRGGIAGAGLDVFQNEPLPLESPLRAFDNVLITPHSSAITDIYLDLALEEFGELLNNYRKGEQLFNIVSRAEIKSALERKRTYDKADSMKR